MSPAIEMVSPGKQYIFPESACAIFVGVDSKSELLLIEQWRSTHNMFTLELPGGKLVAGETPEQAAIRELFEETGIIADKAKLLVSLDLDLSISKHRTHLVVVCSNTQEINESARDDLKSYSLLQAWDLVESGRISHAPTVVAILMLLKGGIDV